MTSSNSSSGEDVALAWNLIMQDATAHDHSLSRPDQPGPTRTSRAFAIVSVAVFDAWNSIYHRYTPYLSDFRGYERADERIAVATAAYETLRVLYPQQKASFAAAHADWLRRVPLGTARTLGIQLGRRVALAILGRRANDGSNATMTYVPSHHPGYHQADPLHPDQGFLDPQWGFVTPFVLRNVHDYLSPPPPPLNSPEYAEALEEVMLYGGDGVTTPTLRTPRQTETGIFWGYDGTPGLGTPPRMFNQIVRVIAIQRRNNVERNVRLFALVHLAMADAGIQCWYVKYHHEFWRPIMGIRYADLDGNPDTVPMPDWTPLGAPATNGAGNGVNFTPPFPAYTSGHATFGAAALWTVAGFYNNWRIPFSITSDEFNGINTNGDGSPRPVVTRSYSTLDEAIWENAYSRIFLGIHWSFDATEGVAAGKRISREVVSKVLRPRN
jgi:hypothetical protein